MRVNGVVIVAPLVGDIRRGVGATVSRCTKKFLEILSQLLLIIVTKISFGQSTQVSNGLCIIDQVRCPVRGDPTTSCQVIV